MNPLQPEKAECFIDSNVEGSVRVPVNPLQLSKADLPIEVNEFGSVRLPVKPVQNLKADSSIIVNEFGSVRVPVKLSHLKKASKPINSSAPWFEPMWRSKRESSTMNVGLFFVPKTSYK